MWRKIMPNGSFYPVIYSLVAVIFILHGPEPAAALGPSEVPDTVEYRCQVPMHLTDFHTHLQRGYGHRSIVWNLGALDPNADMRARLIQMSADGISPGASLVLPGVNGLIEIPMKALTMERKWLNSLRGTDAMELLPETQQLVMWINEVYHLFVIGPGDIKMVSADEPFWKAWRTGAYIFSDRKMAFIIDKDQSYLTVCPRLYEGKVKLSSKQISTEAVRFMLDERIRKFFGCEALLSAHRI